MLIYPFYSPEITCADSVIIRPAIQAMKWAIDGNTTLVSGIAYCDTNNYFAAHSKSCLEQNLNFSCKAGKNVIPRRDEDVNECLRLYTLLVLTLMEGATIMTREGVRWERGPPVDI